MIYETSANVQVRAQNKSINVPITDESKPEIRDNIKGKWQTSLNTLATVFDVPASLIMRISKKDIEVLLGSTNIDNPYKAGDKDSLGHGLYCETVIATGTILEVEDATKEPVWEHNPDVKLNMIHYTGLPVRWPDGETYGTLCVLDSRARKHSQAYISLLRDYRAMIEADLEREIYIDVVEKNSAALELRMREIHHRVKNHFAIISQLIQLSGAGRDSATILADVSSKLNTVALLHEKIYKDLNQAPALQEYVAAVAQATIDLLNKPIKLIIDFKVQPSIDQKHLLDFGLVTSELVTNSIKYSAQGLDTEVTIVMELCEVNGNYCFEIRDNGVGFSQEILDGKGIQGFGSMMVEAFAKSHRGHVERFNHNGAVTRCIAKL